MRENASEMREKGDEFMPKPGNPVPVNVLIRRLRLMADAGGMLTRDRIRTVRDAADQLEQLDERVAIMSECEVKRDESD